jgi:hemerythrin-like metal-binding protein
MTRREKAREIARAMYTTPIPNRSSGPLQRPPSSKKPSARNKRYHAVVDALREDEVDVFLARLRDLREWLDRHFKNEEAALQRIGCREAYQHREDHQQFIDTLEDFTRNSEKVYGYQERLAVARYIFYWLIRHGKAYDAKITLHLRHGTAMN